MKTPPVTYSQIESAFKLLARACAAPVSERAAYFPLTVLAFNGAYNEYLAPSASRASPEYVANEINTCVRDCPRCFALLECWLAQNPAHSQQAGRFIMALGDYISGEPSGGAFAFSRLRTALPIAIRACLDDLWR